MIGDNYRISWASEHLKSVWAPRLTKIHTAWFDVEIGSVASGIRQAALVFGEQAKIEEAALWHGLVFEQVTPGRYVFAKNKTTLKHFLESWNNRDDHSIGNWLGFPSCCIEFFNKVWNELGYRDPTLSMDGDPVRACVNILGRWTGVRLVPHLPCSWECQHSADFAKEMEFRWPQTELGWAKEWLSWPVRYSSLHGIAIITNPVAKIVTSTDYQAREARVDMPGIYPDGAPSGVSFPFQKVARIAQVAPLRFERSAGRGKLAPPVESTPSAKENGFATDEAETAAHRMILETLWTLPQLLPGMMVHDLGCGNGTLLKRVRETFGVGIQGFECEASKIREPFIQRLDLRSLDYRLCGDVAIVSVRRYEEIPELSDVLVDRYKYLLEYSYDEPRWARITEAACHTSE